MKRLMKIAALLMLLLLGFAAFRACVTKVPIGYVGVRSNLLHGGIVPQDLGPGLHLSIPGLQQVQLVDARQKWMDWNTTSSNGSFQLTTLDQVTINADVTLIYSLELGKGYLALRKYGENSGYDAQMKVLATKVIADSLSQLELKDFYDAKKRTQQEQKALDDLNHMMHNTQTPEYLVAQDILIRNVSFPQAIEDRLFEKQLLDEKQLLHESETKREASLEVTQTIQKQTLDKVMEIQEQQNQEIQLLQAQTDAEISRIQAQADFYADTVSAEADRYKRERVAQGALLNDEAKAEGDRATGAAYASTGGGWLLLRKMVDNIQLGDIMINTNRTNPFDVMEMLKMLGGNSPVAAPSPAPAVGENAKAGDIAAKVASILDQVKTFDFTPQPVSRPASMPATSPFIALPENLASGK